MSIKEPLEWNYKEVPVDEAQAKTEITEKKWWNYWGEIRPTIAGKQIHWLLNPKLTSKLFQFLCQCSALESSLAGQDQQSHSS